MGNSLSHWASVEVCAKANQSVPCPSKGSTPGNGFPGVGGFKSDSEIAGSGVVYAFVISAFLTLVVTTILLVLDVLYIFTKRQRRWITKGRKILEPVLVSFSDQQMVTGLSLVIVTRWFIGCTISAYHYDIVCNLVLLSVITHLCAVNFITPYFPWPLPGRFPDSILGLCRMVIILFTLSVGYSMLAERNNPGFPTGKPKDAPTDSTHAPYFIAPAACFMSSNNNVTNKGSSHATGYAEYCILVAFTVLSLVVAGIYSFISPEKHPKIMWVWLFRVPLLLTALGVAIGTTNQVLQMRKWMHDSVWPADSAESTWTFGQFFPLLLMILAVLAFLEAFTDHSDEPPESLRYLPDEKYLPYKSLAKKWFHRLRAWALGLMLNVKGTSPASSGTQLDVKETSPASSGPKLDNKGTSPC